MKYYNYEMRNHEIDALLQKYFNDDFGAVVTFDTNGILDKIEVCRLTQDGKATVWTHYAYIFNFDGKYEISEGFVPIDEKFCNEWGDEYRSCIGTNQTALNIMDVNQ